MTNPVAAVVFDYGKVLSGPQDAAQLARLQQLTNVSADSFEARYRADRLAYDRGTISSRDYWENFLRADGRTVDDAMLPELVATDAAAWSGTDPRVIRWAERIGERGVRLAILSNMPADIRAPLVAQHASWLVRFPLRIFSCDVGCVKPDAEIYALLLQRLGVPADRVLFIDDHAGNIEGAKRAGLRTILFTTYDALRDEPLAELGLPAAD